MEPLNTWKDIFSRMTADQRLAFLILLLEKKEKVDKRHSLRPADLLIPAMMALELVLWRASFLPAECALIYATLGNFIIVGSAMLPVL